MMYIFRLQPNQASNRIFAIYMLALATSSYCILVAATATDTNSIYDASRIHTLASLIASPLLWLLVLYTFVPRLRYFRWISLFFLGATAVPLILSVIDSVSNAGLLFVFDSELYTGGFVSVHKVLNGRLGGMLYAIYITLLNTLLVLPLGFFAFSHFLAERLRRAARILLFLSLFVGVVYTFEIPLAFSSLLAPLCAALGAAWVVRFYRFFSPVELAMAQVVDTITIGLLVFDENLYLVDANAFSAKLLLIELAADKDKLTLVQLLQRLMPRVENQEDIVQLLAAIQIKPRNTYHQEVVLLPDNIAENTQRMWLMLTIRPVYDQKNFYIGSSCTVEDLTIERRTQVYITETHKAIEQYAYNQALLNDITQAAIGAFDLDADLTALAGRVVEFLNADNCFITMWDEQEQKPRPAYVYGADEKLYLSLDLTPNEPSISREVCFRRKTMVIEDAYHSPYISPRVARLFPTRGLLALPMVTEQQILGALLVGFNHPKIFTAEEIRWGEQLARQLTLAISKSHLLAAEREQRALLEALQAAGQAIISTLDSEKVMDRILEEIERVVPYDTANFALIKRDEAYIARRRGLNKTKMSLDTSKLREQLSIAEMPTLKTMYETKRPLLISNTLKSPLWSPRDGRIKSWLGVPLVLGETLIAFLMVDKLEAGFYQKRHREWLTAFASQATLALQHAQLFTEIQRRVTELEALSVVSAALRSSDTVPNILQAVLQEMVEILSARVGVAFLLNEAQTAVVSQASYPPDFYPMGVQYQLGEGVTGNVAQTGTMHVVSNLHTDAQWLHKPEEPEEISRLGSTIAFPLISKDGVLGVIHLGLDGFYEFAEDEIRTLKAMCNIVANGLQRIQLMQTLEARVSKRTHELETANEQLQELDKLKTKFIADVSHELRTPVANLSIYINLLQNGHSEKWDHYISVLQQQADRLMSLVEATLSLSRLEIGGQKLEFMAVALNDVIKGIALGHQARAEAMGLTINLLLEPDLPPVIGNQTQVAQLVTNLLANAINYNQVNGQVTLETRVKNETLICLKVIDTGIGVNEAEIPHLFDRFYRGQQTGQSNIPGTGLGLAIVKEIVALHQGSIEVTSQLNVGTTFTVYLPIYKESASLVDQNGSAKFITDDQSIEL